MEEVVLCEKFKMIIGGGLVYFCEWDYKCMCEIVDKVGVIFMIDMVYFVGLIVVGLLDNFVKYVYIVILIIYKIFWGFCGGVIMMGKDFFNFWGKKILKGEIKMMF